METEKDRLEREIHTLKEAYDILGGRGLSQEYIDILEFKRKVLSDLTRPAIKDEVLGRGSRQEDGALSRIITFKNFQNTFNDPDSWTFHPLTIEELLPTLAQWVPGAVRWRYANTERVTIENESGEVFGRIPAPPRDDWESVQGEL